MLIPLDYKELLKSLNRHKVKYLIVGAYAVTYYTEPRYTKDLDIWIKPEIGNAKKVYEVLKEFGAPLKDVTAEDFTNKNLVYQIGVEPVRIDIIMDIPGMNFGQAWQKRKIIPFDGIKINIIGINELIKAKKKSRRNIDILDVEKLRFSLSLGKKK